jgi:hypothetical protein
MGCFGSRVNRPRSSLSYISSWYQQLSEPLPSHFDGIIMRPLTICPSSPLLHHLAPDEASSLTDLNFALFDKSADELKACIFFIFQTRNLQSPCLPALISVIASNYRDNPYHNFLHGFSVCQMIYVVSERNSQLKAFLPENEERLLLLCGLAHDLGHPGVNNGFLINAKDPLAEKYNNTAVLENYHAASFLEFLNMHSFEVEIDAEDREKVVEIILGTDMAQHRQVMETYAEVMQKYEKGKMEHRMSFMRMMIHAADIGNPGLGNELATIWSLRLIAEFRRQVWKEEQMQIKVSEFMRIGNDVEKIKKSQIGFIEAFSLPLWKLVSASLPHCEDIVQNTEENCRIWTAISNL